MYKFLLLILPAICFASDDHWEAGPNGPGEPAFDAHSDRYDDLPGWCDKYGPVTQGPEGCKKIARIESDMANPRTTFLEGPTVPLDYSSQIFTAPGANGPGWCTTIEN